MKSITWYMARQILGMTLLATLVLCFMVWLFRSLDAVDMMLNRGLPVSSFLHFASLTIPRFVLFVAPIAVFGASLFTYNKLINDSELIVLRSAGLSPYAIAKPALIVGLIIAAVSYYFSLFLVPLTYREYKELEFKYRHNLPQLLLQEGVFSSPVPGFTVYFREFGPEGELRDVFIHDSRNPRQPTSYIAEWGRLKETRDGRWIVEMSQGGGQTLKRGNPRAECNPKKLAQGTAANCEYPKFEFFVADSGDNVGFNLFSNEQKRSGRHYREYFLTELLDPTTDDEKYRRVLTAELHTRITRPLLPLTCVMIGIALLLSGGFNRRGQLKLVLGTIVTSAAIIIVSHALRNYAPKVPLLIWAMYANALMPLAIGLILLLFPRPLSHPIARESG